jgi:hypothetical protein
MSDEDSGTIHASRMLTTVLSKSKALGFLAIFRKALGFLAIFL